MTTKTPFDFSSIAGLGAFWDGTKSLKGGTSKPGGGKFNNYAVGSQANIDHNLGLLYQNLVGRNPDSGGKKYWGDKLKAGTTTYGQIADSLKASGEYTDQQAAIAAGATAADLKALDSAHVSPFHFGSGSAVANWKPGDPLTMDMAKSIATTVSNADGSQKLDSAGNPIQKNSYEDQTNSNVQNVIDSLKTSTGVDFTGHITGGNQSKQDLIDSLGLGPSGPSGPGDGWLPSNPVYQKYDDSALKAMLAGLQGEFASLKDAFGSYKDDMMNMWNNANWGQGGYGQTVGGVKTQNELPGWSPKKGGTAGFFGRGGSRFGLTTSSLNI